MSGGSLFNKSVVFRLLMTKSRAYANMLPLNPLNNRSKYDRQMACSAGGLYLYSPCAVCLKPGSNRKFRVLNIVDIGHQIVFYYASAHLGFW